MNEYIRRATLMLERGIDPRTVERELKGLGASCREAKAAVSQAKRDV